MLPGKLCSLLVEAQYNPIRYVHPTEKRLCRSDCTLGTDLSPSSVRRFRTAAYDSQTIVSNRWFSGRPSLCHAATVGGSFRLGSLERLR